MADLWALREVIRDQIEADEGCYGIKTQIEAEMIVGPGDTPAAIVYLEERSTPPDEQALALHRSWLLNFNVLVGAFSLGGFGHAVQRRDDAIVRVEAALLRDRRLGGLVHDLWLTGGRMLVAPQDRGVLAWGEVRFVVRVFEGGVT